MPHKHQCLHDVLTNAETDMKTRHDALKVLLLKYKTELHGQACITTIKDVLLKAYSQGVISAANYARHLLHMAISLSQEDAWQECNGLLNVLHEYLKLQRNAIDPELSKEDAEKIQKQLNTEYKHIYSYMIASTRSTPEQAQAGFFKKQQQLIALSKQYATEPASAARAIKDLILLHRYGCNNFIKREPELVRQHLLALAKCEQEQYIQPAERYSNSIVEAVLLQGLINESHVKQADNKITYLRTIMVVETNNLRFHVFNIGDRRVAIFSPCSNDANKIRECSDVQTALCYFKAEQAKSDSVLRDCDEFYIPYCQTTKTGNHYETIHCFKGQVFQIDSRGTFKSALASDRSTVKDAFKRYFPKMPYDSISLGKQAADNDTDCGLFTSLNIRKLALRVSKPFEYTLQADTQRRSDNQLCIQAFNNPEFAWFQHGEQNPIESMYAEQSVSFDDAGVQNTGSASPEDDWLFMTASSACF